MEEINPSHRLLTWVPEIANEKAHPRGLGPKQFFGVTHSQLIVPLLDQLFSRIFQSRNHRLAAAPINRSHSPRLPRNPSVWRLPGRIVFKGT